MRNKTQRGQGLVEMALILPFLLVLMIGLIELSVALNRQLIVVNAAREGARFGAFGAEADDIYAQTLLATSQMFEFTEENAVVAVIQATTDEGGDSFAEWAETVYPADAAVPYVTQDEVLAELRAGGNTVNLKLVVVEVRYDHQSMLGLPVVGALADRIPIGSWTAMRVASLNPAPRGPGCCVLPITLSVWDVEGLTIGDELMDIRIGDSPGQFGWLFWQPDDPGAGSVPVLKANLDNRCNAKNFQDACDGTAGMGPGSWAWGDSGEMVGVNEDKEDKPGAVSALIGAYYPVPVWDEFEACNVLKAQGKCSYCKPGSKVAHIVAFALMEITEVSLTGSPKIISARFRGWYENCK